MVIDQVDGMEPGEDPGAAARTLMRACGRATLATRHAGTGPGAQTGVEGWPSPTLVLVAFDPDAAPLLLISHLAEHTRNLEADPRCGLLFDGTGGHADALTGPRLSLLGRAERDGDGRRMARFLARHPSANAYAGFADFGLWRVEPLRGHMVAGFGRISAMPAEQLHLPPADWAELAAAEDEIVTHMNQDHADALVLYATRLLDLPAGDWQMTGIDPEGCDLRDGTTGARLPFGRRVRNAEAARAELVRLVKQARAA